MDGGEGGMAGNLVAVGAAQVEADLQIGVGMRGELRGEFVLAHARAEPLLDGQVLRRARAGALEQLAGDGAANAVVKHVQEHVRRVVVAPVVANDEAGLDALLLERHEDHGVFAVAEAHAGADVPLADLVLDGCYAVVQALLQLALLGRGVLRVDAGEVAVVRRENLVDDLGGPALDAALGVSQVRPEVAPPFGVRRVEVPRDQAVRVGVFHDCLGDRLRVVLRVQPEVLGGALQLAHDLVLQGLPRQFRRKLRHGDDVPGAQRLAERLARTEDAVEGLLAKRAVGRGHRVAKRRHDLAVDLLLAGGDRPPAQGAQLGRIGAKDNVPRREERAVGYAYEGG